MKNQANSITVEGVLTSDVKLTYDETKKASIGKFYLKNTTKVGKNIYHNDFYIVVYGRKAETCEQHLHIGSNCTVSGKVSTWYKPDKNGNMQPGVTILASEVFFKEEEAEEEEIIAD